MTSLASFLEAFRALASDADLNALIAQHELTRRGHPQQPSAHVLKVVGGVVGGCAVCLTYWYHEPDGPYAETPDQVQLEVDGEPVAVVTLRINGD